MDDLVVTVGGVAANSVRVSNWFSATGNRIDELETSGGTITTADQIDALIAGGGGSFANSVAPPSTTGPIEASANAALLDALRSSGMFSGAGMFGGVALSSLAVQRVIEARLTDSRLAQARAAGAVVTQFADASAVSADAFAQRAGIHMVRDPGSLLDGVALSAEVVPPMSDDRLIDSLFPAPVAASCDAQVARAALGRLLLGASAGGAAWGALIEQEVSAGLEAAASLETTGDTAPGNNAALSQWAVTHANLVQHLGANGRLLGGDVLAEIERADSLESAGVFAASGGVSTRMTSPRAGRTPLAQLV